MADVMAAVWIQWRTGLDACRSVAVVVMVRIQGRIALDTLLDDIRVYRPGTLRIKARGLGIMTGMMMRTRRHMLLGTVGMDMSMIQGMAIGVIEVEGIE
jgi:hypothetical protein